MTQTRSDLLHSPPQVFLTFAPADRPLASQISRALEGAGLKVVYTGSIGTDRIYDESIRSAIEQSLALVVAFSGRGGSEIASSVVFEIGAAMGAGKPIFVVVDQPTFRLPFRVPQLRILPIGRVDEIGMALNAAIA